MRALRGVTTQSPTPEKPCEAEKTMHLQEELNHRPRSCCRYLPTAQQQHGLEGRLQLQKAAQGREHLSFVSLRPSPSGDNGGSQNGALVPFSLQLALDPELSGASVTRTHTKEGIGSIPDQGAPLSTRPWLRWELAGDGRELSFPHMREAPP